MTRFTACLLPSAIAAALSVAPIAQANEAAPQPAPASAAESPPQGARARNVILFLADAAGVAVLNAASLMAYNEPLKLRIQQWPHLGLSETSPVDRFVSDSANGMTAIVTGTKTRNGVISQGPDAVRGQRDGAPLKTLLEHAEERGLLTGVISSQSIADATPAATYAHANDRSRWGDIFPQALAPRFGNGVDVLIGAGRQEIGEQLAANGTSFDQLGTRYHRPIRAMLADVPASDSRPIVVSDAIDVRLATLKALDLLEQSPSGYFLVVEWDAHTPDPQEGLENLANFDRLIAEVESRVDLSDTLLLFTADHSFGLHVDGGRRGEPLLAGYDAWKASGNKDEMVRLDNLMVKDTHTAEEVPALAIGAGAEEVRGYFPNTQLFRIMMNAWGWTGAAVAPSGE
ncbi:alkaline phosphatase (plasmid) [Croceibacterium sp. TMG7-5b_MA50]|uniref:alkaline phosphatase n=1 Tax=Croceibacterium sp. TMG7-5b_MA50 TaxID=3121290 RepID=UPI0032219D38